MIDNRESDILSTLPEPLNLCSRYVWNQGPPTVGRPRTADSRSCHSCHAELLFRPFGQISSIDVRHSVGVHEGGARIMRSLALSFRTLRGCPSA